MPIYLPYFLFVFLLMYSPPVGLLFVKESIGFTLQDVLRQRGHATPHGLHCPAPLEAREDWRMDGNRADTLPYREPKPPRQIPFQLLSSAAPTPTAPASCTVWRIGLDGISGGGKSTVAHELGAALRSPFLPIGLDEFFFTKAEREQQQQHLCQEGPNNNHNIQGEEDDDWVSYEDARAIDVGRYMRCVQKAAWTIRCFVQIHQRHPLAPQRSCTGGGSWVGTDRPAKSSTLNAEQPSPHRATGTTLQEWHTFVARVSPDLLKFMPPVSQSADTTAVAASPSSNGSAEGDGGSVYKPHDTTVDPSGVEDDESYGENLLHIRSCQEEVAAEYRKEGLEVAARVRSSIVVGAPQYVDEDETNREGDTRCPAVGCHHKPTMVAVGCRSSVLPAEEEDTSPHPREKKRMRAVIHAFLICEGFILLSYPPVRNAFDVYLHVHCSEEVGCLRRFLRAPRGNAPRNPALPRGEGNEEKSAAVDGKTSGQGNTRPQTTTGLMSAARLLTIAQRVWESRCSRRPGQRARLCRWWDAALTNLEKELGLVAPVRGASGTPSTCSDMAVDGAEETMAKERSIISSTDGEPKVKPVGATATEGEEGREKIMRRVRAHFEHWLSPASYYFPFQDPKGFPWAPPLPSSVPPPVASHEADAVAIRRRILRSAGWRQCQRESPPALLLERCEPEDAQDVAGTKSNTFTFFELHFGVQNWVRVEERIATLVRHFCDQRASSCSSSRTASRDQQPDPSLGPNRFFDASAAVSSSGASAWGGMPEEKADTVLFLLAERVVRDLYCGETQAEMQQLFAATRQALRDYMFFRYWYTYEVLYYARLQQPVWMRPTGEGGGEGAAETSAARRPLHTNGVYSTSNLTRTLSRSVYMELDNDFHVQLPSTASLLGCRRCSALPASSSTRERLTRAVGETVQRLDRLIQGVYPKPHNGTMGGCISAEWRVVEVITNYYYLKIELLLDPQTRNRTPKKIRITLARKERFLCLSHRSFSGHVDSHLERFRKTLQQQQQQKTPERTMMRTKTELVLHGGEVFEGYSFGYEKSVAGEVVFTTGMVGYPESLTDPSYTGQILVLTSPMIGNYGVPAVEQDFYGVTKFFESPDGKIHVSAVVVQEYCDQPDHWQLYESLGSWLRRNKIPGMMMVDTRSIVTKLRGMGTALGKVVVGGAEVPFDDPNTRNLVAEVSTKIRRTYGHGTIRILVIDMGVKLNTLRCLLKFDVTLIVVPHDWDITTEQYDGLFISNGPGNPQLCTATIRHVRWALTQDQPIFGICMGNQMLALAAGGSTYKMKFGHRGQNQPCKCTKDGKVVITTQNHGFAVDFKTMPSEWEEYFINPNDGSSEGLCHKTKPFYSVQFHPEACCGPKDTEYLFGEFIDRVKHAKIEEMKRFKPNKVLVLGAGGIVIAQAGEFDYSGSQCLKSLREEGIQTVLINPNIATVQTDDESADTVYFVPVTPETVERVIEKERPDGLMLGWGGQTALNCGLELHQRGVLKKYNVRVLGTPVSVIRITEDRELFRDTLLQINEHVAKSVAVTTLEEAIEAQKTIGFPMMVRAAFCLGGQGSGIVRNEDELREKVTAAFAIAPQVLLEESVAGWKEIEYEVIRDIYDNCITVCNMENVDPMGIHTGESIVVAPSQTLSNDEFHMLRSASIKIIRHLGIVGECNIQYGLDPNSHRYVVIEVNARLSRSSALASKATGYPLAHVATKVALGKGLFEITNGVTKTTMACFEPSLDYIVVKIPRWDLSKFNMVSQRIGSMMKSVGEVMAIGRTFEEAFQKAIRMTDPSNTGFDVPAALEQPQGVQGEKKPWDYKDIILHPTPQRIFALCKALEDGMTVEELFEMTKITRFFLYKLDNIVKLKKSICTMYKGSEGLAKITKAGMQQIKGKGFSDIQIGRYIGCTAEQVRAKRIELNVMPVVKQIDTVAGEYPAAQCCYLYTSYNAQHDDISFNDRMYAVLGCGVYRIGNSVEFDYGGVLVARELRRLGNKVIMINYNPETVSTDYDECDRLYFEEISEETVLDIFTKERIRGVVISLGGQIVQNMALKLKEAGLPILGTDPQNIDMAEDRNKFSAMCDELGVPQPEWVSATSVDEVYRFCDRVQYPALVRPSYVLSGSAMAVISNKEDVQRYLEEASLISGEYPVVVSKYYENAMEYDVDIVAHHGRVLCYAICEHVENAGVHSGDATMLLPPQNTTKETMKNIYDAVIQIAAKLDITGPMNVQLLLTAEGQLRVIEANVRSSRSVPFVSKTLGISFPAVMVSVFLAKKDQDLVPIRRAKMTHIGCKAAMFSFNRLAGADPILGVEMASTGEVGVFGRTKNEVIMKALYCQNFKPPKKGVFFFSEEPGLTSKLLPCLARLAGSLRVFTCQQNSKDLKDYGIAHEVLRLPGEVDETGRAAGDYETEVSTKEKFDLVIQLRDKRKDFLLRRVTIEMAPPSYFVRRLAVDFNVPLITEPNLLKCFSEAWDITQDKIEVEPFSHYVPKVYHKIENNNCAMLRQHKVGLMISDNISSKVLALRLLEENINITCFHAYLGGISDVEAVEQIFRGMNANVEIVDLRSNLASAAFDLIMCQTMNDEKNWHLSKLTRHLLGQHLLLAMRDANMTAVAQTSRKNRTEVGFETYVHLYAPRMGVYNAWRDQRLMEDIASMADQIAYLRQHGVMSSVSNNTLAHSSICGNTYYCDDVRDLPPPSMVKPLRECSPTPEFVSIRFRSAQCVGINGVECTPLLALNMANDIAGRHGIGLARTRNGAMYESPGMTLLSLALRYLYDVFFDRPSADLFRTYSRHVSMHISQGMLHEKHVSSAIEAIRYLTSDVSGVVELEVHMGEAIFLKMSQVGAGAKTLYHNTISSGTIKSSTDLVTEEELEEVFLPGNGSFSDVQW
eukprot:gene7012-4974_t